MKNDEHYTNQPVEQMVNSMATVLANYLDPEQINILTKRWREYSEVSVKMIQQSILEATRRYPKLSPYKSEIRKGFWEALQGSAATSVAVIDQNNRQSSNDSVCNAFYSVFEAIQKELTAPQRSDLIYQLHQLIIKERTFTGHGIDVTVFLNNDRPKVPDDAQMLNTLVQLTYICLCNIIGPMEADNILYKSAESAKQVYPKAVVEQLF